MSDTEEAVPTRRPAKAGFAAALLDDDSGSSSDDAAPPARSKVTVAAPAPAPTPAPAAKPAAGGGKAAAKGKGKKGGKAAAAADDDDDWALLEEAAKANAPAAATPAPAPAAAAAAAPAPSKASAAKDAAAAFLASSGPAATADAPADDDGADGDAGGDKAGAASDKKKKRRPKGKAGGGGGGGGGGAAGGSDDEGGDAAAAPAAAAAAAGGGKKLSAAAKAAQERLAAVAEFERKRAAELKAIEEYNEALRLKEEAEAKARADKKAREKEKLRAKIEAEKAAGTYMTKKEREALEKRRARLGVDVTSPGGGSEEPAASPTAADGGDGSGDAGSTPDAAAAAAAGSGAAKKASALYADAKRRGKGAAAAAAAGADDASAAAAPAAAAAVEAAAPAPPPAPVDDWEAVADDWESAADTVLPPGVAPSPSPPPGAATGAAAASSGDGGGSSGSSKKCGFPYPKGVPTFAESLGKCVEDRIDDSRMRREIRLKAAQDARSSSRLRSPICVVLGHVDTGKTSLLDYIRRTNVQSGEAGGITQQIGATYCPMDRLRTATDKLNKDLHLEYKIPGLLIIDTPGHESFVNLRSRGAGLCDIAVLVVDVMHGLERQTIESINLLRQKKTKFVVALNKVDRMYGWRPTPNAPILETLAKQPDYTVSEFETRSQLVLTQLAEQGLNAKLYYENDDFRTQVSVVPTSAHTGEGIPDLLMLLVQVTQQLMSHRILFMDYVQCTILEVKSMDGLGTTVDVVLVSGELKEGDTIVVCGMDGPIVTQIRALLTPPPLREIRVKSDYVHHKRIEAAMGVKIAAQYLDKAVAGTSLLVAHEDDDIEDLKAEVMEDFEKIMKGFARAPVGVYVQASTLGSLEALLEYLRTHDPPVPVAHVGIGPLHKKDVVQASVMLEHREEYATILAFDVKVTPEAAAAAATLGVRIFTAEIIYHLTDQFEAYLKKTLEDRMKATAAEAVYPVVAKMIPTAIFNKRDPIVVGVDILEGKLKVGTPLCVIVPAESAASVGTAAAAAGGAGDDGSGVKGAERGPKGSVILELGRVASIEHNHTAVDVAEAGGPSVAVKIVAREGSQQYVYGRHFDHNLPLYAKVSRASIDLLKEHFRSEMTKEHWKTVIKLKELLGVD